MAGSHCAVVAIDVHGRVGEVVTGRHGCGSTSSMRRGTRTWRIRHVGNRSALPLISRTCKQPFLPRVRDDDETIESKNNEEVACSVRGQALLCLLFPPLKSVMAFFVIAHSPLPTNDKRPCLPLLPVSRITACHAATLHQRAEYTLSLYHQPTLQASHCLSSAF